jgi:peptidoglycan hydrolase-like protein with peptidoglycan-binding domain/predicted RNA-binding Zn-ribbon protein involved in translation (DUF1610 family)
VTVVEEAVVGGTTAGMALASRGTRGKVKVRPGGVPAPKKKPGEGEAQNAEFERLHPRSATGQFTKKQGDGMREPDPQVADIQRRINSAGTGKVAVDGRFGVVTREAVKKFQREAGINANGIVDPNTYEAMLNPPPLSREEVIAQEKADEEGASKGSASRAGARVAGEGGAGELGRADAASRARREAAAEEEERGTGRSTSRKSPRSADSVDASDPDSVREFQRQHGIRVDGIIGPQTQAAMKRAREDDEDRERRDSGRDTGGDDSGRETGSSRSSAGGSSDGDRDTRGGRDGSMLRQGEGMDGKSSTKVKAIQEMLDELGYDLGEGGVDGKFGPDTKAALQELQDDYGLKADGVVGLKTRRLINRLASRLKSETAAVKTGKAPKDDYKLVEGTMIEEARKSKAAGSPAKCASCGKAMPLNVKANRDRCPNCGKALKTDSSAVEEAEVGKPGTNWKQVGPDAKKKLSPLVRHYMKQAHPFTACVRDNTKRFGPDRAARICAVVKDLGRRTTKWRNGGDKKLSEADFIEGFVRDLVEAGIEDHDDLVLVEAFLVEQRDRLALAEAIGERMTGSGTQAIRAQARERALRARLPLQEAEVRPATSLAEVIRSLNPGSALRLNTGEVHRLTDGGYLVLYAPAGTAVYQRKRASSAAAAAATFDNINAEKATA